MNKRQIKKKNKILNERFQFLSKHHYSSGRRNGKTFLFKSMLKAYYSKKYKPFKSLRKSIIKYLSQ